MAKGIILIENPKACIECPMFYHADNISIGRYTYQKLYRCKMEPEEIEDPYLKDILHNKPDWCPIQEIDDEEEFKKYKLERGLF